MANWKHKLKMRMRLGFAWCFAYTPLGALANRLAPPRVLILFGHCIDDDGYGGILAPEMCLSKQRFGEVLDALEAKRVQFATIGGAWDLLQSGTGGRALVAISMDDGYLDNALVMAPMLAKRGIPATVFLETRALDQRRVNWTHHLHWLFDELGAQGASEGLIELAEGAAGADSVGKACAELGRVVKEALAVGGDAYYHVKRRLKYDVDPAQRDRLMAGLFAGSGGDDGALAERLYMNWDQARGLRDGGFELGGHTVSHSILSSLDAAGQAGEVQGSVDSMAAALGSGPRVFAYPFGRRWDYNPETQAAVLAAGCELAVNTHCGTNTKASAALELRRVPVEEGTPMSLVLAEACGGFLLLERLGLRLSE